MDDWKSLQNETEILRLTTDNPTRVGFFFCTLQIAALKFPILFIFTNQIFGSF